MIVWVPENIATLVLATSGVSDLLLGAVKGFWNFHNTSRNTQTNY